MSCSSEAHPREAVAFKPAPTRYRGVAVAALLLVGAFGSCGATCRPTVPAVPFAPLQPADPLPRGASALAVGAGAGFGGIGNNGTAAFGSAAQWHVAVTDRTALTFSGHSLLQLEEPENVGYAASLGFRKSRSENVVWVGSIGYADVGFPAVGGDTGAVWNVGDNSYMALLAGVGAPLELDEDSFRAGYVYYGIGRTAGSTKRWRFLFGLAGFAAANDEGGGVGLAAYLGIGYSLVGFAAVNSAVR